MVITGFLSFVVSMCVQPPLNRWELRVGRPYLGLRSLCRPCGQAWNDGHDRGANGRCGVRVCLFFYLFCRFRVFEWLSDMARKGRVVQWKGSISWTSWHELIGGSNIGRAQNRIRSARIEGTFPA
ncbi:hypothetical protein V6N12_051142 [Hibiscus sabdariffa]|uniref:Secreted protein n=1 Tax=Hibiscus sabdariffa TaxID=183260 RepID=A0ABR2GF32_9ROSI